MGDVVARANALDQASRIGGFLGSVQQGVPRVVTLAVAAAAGVDGGRAGAVGRGHPKRVLQPGVWRGHEDQGGTAQLLDVLQPQRVGRVE